MKFLETSDSLQATDFDEVEKELKIILPDDFKEHYIKYNGGYPENDVYHWRNGGTTTINCFASIKYTGFDNLEDIYRNLILKESYLPIGILPFAFDDGGNFFCISCRAKDFDSVFYCNNDHYNTTNREECLTLLDTNFKHFVDNFSK